MDTIESLEGQIIKTAERYGFEHWAGPHWIPDNDNEVGQPEGDVVCEKCGANGYYSSIWKREKLYLYLNICYECGFRSIYIELGDIPIFIKENKSGPTETD